MNNNNNNNNNTLFKLTNNYNNSALETEEAISWWSNLPIEKEMTREEISSFSREELISRVKEIHDKAWPIEVQDILENVTLVSITNIHEIFGAMLETWHSQRVVLIGDAAHAMPPSSGQGTSLALEDSLYLAKIFRDNLNGNTSDTAIPSETLEQVFRKFEEGRIPRVNKIGNAARKMGSYKKITNPVAVWLRDRIISLIFWWMGPDHYAPVHGYQIDF